MKLKKILNKRILMMLFCTLTLILVLENPSISQINIYYSYTTLSITAPQLADGVFYQGSSIITQDTITYINQTSNEPLAYKTVLSIFNFGSLFVAFSPIVFYVYFNKKQKEQKAKPLKKKVVVKNNNHKEK